MERRPALLFSYRSISVCFSLGVYDMSCWINEILESFCEMPKRSPARAPFYQAVISKMLEPRIVQQPSRHGDISARSSASNTERIKIEQYHKTDIAQRRSMYGVTFPFSATAMES